MKKIDKFIEKSWVNGIKRLVEETYEKWESGKNAEAFKRKFSYSTDNRILGAYRGRLKTVGVKGLRQYYLNHILQEFIKENNVDLTEKTIIQIEEWMFRTHTTPSKWSDDIKNKIYANKNRIGQNILSKNLDIFRKWYNTGNNEVEIENMKNSFESYVGEIEDLRDNLIPPL